MIKHKHLGRIGFIVAIALTVSITSSATYVKADPATTSTNATSTVTTAPSSMTQADIDKQNKDTEDKKTALTQQEQDLKTKVQQANEQINELDNQISNFIVKIQENKHTIDKLNAKIKSTQQEVDEKKSELNKARNIANNRVRAMYINNPLQSYLGVMFSSDSLTDLVTNIESIKTIMASDKEAIASLNAKQKQIEGLLADLSSQKEQAQQLMQDNQTKSSQLVQQKEDATTKIADLNNQISTYSSEITKLNPILANQLQSSGLLNLPQDSNSAQLTQKVKDELTKHTFTPLSTVGTQPYWGDTNLSTSNYFTQKDVIMYASTFLGMPYVWGGTSPADGGMDCSGFVRYVYSHFGVYLPRVSEDQQFVGTPITKESDLQPGDLIFFGYPAHHVGMYISPGYMIEAPHTGDVIKIAPYGDYTSASRVVDWSAIAQNKR